MSDLERHFTTSEVATALSVSPPTVWRLIKARKLRAFSINGRLRIPASAVQKYLRSVEVSRG